MSDRAANDTINRQDAIEVLNKLDVSDGVGISSVACDLQKKAIRSIKNLPSVQPDMSGYSDRLWKLAYERGKRDARREWIPVTDRLPEDDEEVIVSCTDDSGDTPFSYTTVAWHFKGTWICNDERCFFITAWMPLPEPYKEGTDEAD